MAKALKMASVGPVMVTILSGQLPSEMLILAPLWRGVSRPQKCVHWGGGGGLPTTPDTTRWRLGTSFLPAREGPLNRVCTSGLRVGPGRAGPRAALLKGPGLHPPAAQDQDAARPRSPPHASSSRSLLSGTKVQTRVGGSLGLPPHPSQGGAPCLTRMSPQPTPQPGEEAHSFAQGTG